MKGSVSIAAPVKNNKGNVIAAVSIAGPTRRINKQTIPKLIKQVHRHPNKVLEKIKLKKMKGESELVYYGINCPYRSYKVFSENFSP